MPSSKRSRSVLRVGWTSIAVVVLLLTAAVAVVDLGENAACDQPLSTFPPCASAPAAGPSPPRNATPIILAPQTTDSSTLGAISGTFAPYLIPNDTIMLSSGAPESNGTPSAAALNDAMSSLRPALPGGIHFEARTAGLTNVEDLVTGGLSSAFSGVVYDYEPGFEPEFTFNFTSTLSNFRMFAAICQEHGYAAFGYPTSQPLTTPGDAIYDWNYGAIANTTGVADLQVQLQGAAHAGTTQWQMALGNLIHQYAENGLPPRALAVQLTLAVGDPNVVSVASAYTDFEYAVERGVGAIVLWWNSAAESEVQELLGMVR
jgi:hypothetical protein